MTRSPKVWFITGTSRGFGRIWTEEALARGDRVVVTARDTTSLQPLVDLYGNYILPVRLDVRDQAAVIQAVRDSRQYFGRLDVVVNNAGYGLFGMVEEVSEAEARAQFETNFFGALWVTQAALPIMRSQGSGHIVQISSIGGVTAYPLFGVYNASKWALEGLSQALAAEVAPFGIKVTLIEPASFETDWAGVSAVHAKALSSYDHLRYDVLDHWSRKKPSDPRGSAEALFRVVDAPAPPLRAFLGDGLLDEIRSDYEQRLAEWAQWSDEAVGALNYQP